MRSVGNGIDAIHGFCTPLEICFVNERPHGHMDSEVLCIEGHKCNSTEGGNDPGMERAPHISTHIYCGSVESHERACLLQAVYGTFLRFLSWQCVACGCLACCLVLREPTIRSLYG